MAKELSIEEKAERYNKALEIAKGFYKGYKQRGNQLYADDLEIIFPELKEDKSERIRKVIYGWICTQPSQDFDNGFSKEEMLAWVENIGKPKTLWTENDRIMAFTLQRDVDQMTYISKEGKNERLNWLNSLEEKFICNEPKLVPKFSVGQRIFNRNGEMPAFIIDRIEDDSYKGKNGESVSIAFQDEWEHCSRFSQSGGFSQRQSTSKSKACSEEVMIES